MTLGAKASKALQSSLRPALSVCKSLRPTGITIRRKGVRDPIGPIATYYSTYTVDDTSKTMTYHIQRSSFPG